MGDSAVSGEGRDDGDPSMAGARQASVAMSLDWAPWLARVGGRAAFVYKVQLDVAESFHIIPKECPMPA